MSLRRPSSTAIVAYLALFISLGGTSFAVTKLARNSVGSEQVKDQSLQANDLAPGVAVSGPRGPRGATGPVGPAGPQGPAGTVNAYIGRVATMSFPQTAGTRANVVSVRVPAGSYALTFATHFWSDTANAQVDCWLVVGGRDLVHGAIKIGPATSAARESTMALTEVATVPAAATLSAQCAQRTTDVPIGVEGIRLLAIPVAAVDEQ